MHANQLFNIEKIYKVNAMTFKLFRRGSARCVGLLSAFVTILICLYYISIGQPTIERPLKDSTTTAFTGGANNNHANGMSVSKNYSKRAKESHLEQNKFDIFERKKQQKDDSKKQQNKNLTYKVEAENSNREGKCYILNDRPTDITAKEEYAKFDFQPEWMSSKEFWDRGFEERFEAQKKEKNRPPLKVIVVPHSHNDPGWLKTFINYFQSDSRQILNSIIKKMQEYEDMTFIWTEISFLQLWWDQAHPTKQRVLKRLVNSGRFEITTGGWVMTDEANVHLYAMLDQLIEGHQWLRNNLNVTPKIGWSIDPFGHGSTVPYLLSKSDFEGTIIQRIHYAWKQWFAREQKGDFMWQTYWQQQQQHDETDESDGSILTHNMPFDIYSIKHSCGPHPFICLNFDFRKIPGEYTDYSVKAQFITNENVEAKAQLLLEQYARTASLFPHNVALIPIGDDFRYSMEREVNQQYTNYKKLIDHIMANKRLYNVDISFGTPRDYFNAIRKRSKNFPSFKGDFFVYSDIFSDGNPAYWSGYFTTRPFYKILSSDLEHNLRAAEILFTIAYNTALQNQDRHATAIKILEKNYDKIIHARRNLGLFQHHDAITGTSKSAVMRDYGMRLFESLQNVIKMQEATIELLIQNDSSSHNFILSELERENFTKLPRKTPISIGSVEKLNSASFVIYNSLAQARIEVITLRSPIPNVKVVNELGQEIRHFQINPVWNISDASIEMDASQRIHISNRQYEVMFVAELKPLSLTTFKIEIDDINYRQSMASVYCDDCSDTTAFNNEFLIKSKPPGDIQLENDNMRLLFDGKNGFLKSITRKPNGSLLQCAIKFAAYRSAQFHSGAYLFKTERDNEKNEAEKDILEQYEDVRVIITSGAIANDVTVVYGAFLAHTVRIFNTHTYLDAGIYIENDIDFEPAPKNRESELFMRFVTDIDNVEQQASLDFLKTSNPVNPTLSEMPVFYTDENGFQYHKRTKVPGVGIEGNYYPITSGTFIQDSKVRFTLLTNHAQGAASYEAGQLEVMLDRRTLYDDYRGMGEGIVDSRLTRHKFCLLIENMPEDLKNTYQVPSLLANHLANGLRYPVNLYFVETMDNADNSLQLKPQVTFFDSSGSGSLPCDVHLLNLRTLSEEKLQLFPSQSALLILHRQGYDCSFESSNDLKKTCTHFELSLDSLKFKNLNIGKLESTGLTGMSVIDQNKKITSLADIFLKPMELRTFNLTFTL